MALVRYYPSINDPTIDIALATFLFLCCAISTFLNPLVFYHNFKKKKKSIPRLLFMVLATIDFTTCLVNPVHVAIWVLADENNITFSMSSATTLERFHGSLSWFLNFYPCSVTALLTFARFVQIKFPFLKIHIKYIVIILVLLGLSQYSFIVAVLVTPKVFWVRPLKMVWSDAAFGLTRTQIVYWWSSIPILMQVHSIFISGLTILELVRQSRTSPYSQSRNNNLIGSAKILITNTGSICYVVIFILSLHFLTDPKDETEFILSTLLNFTQIHVMPVTLSALNPLIYIIFTKEVIPCWKQHTKQSRHVTSNKQVPDASVK